MEETIIKIVLAIIFSLSVVGKLTGKTKSTFEDAGYSQVIMYATAIAEIIFTVGLFTRYEIFAAAGLLAIMDGAVFTLFRLKVEPAKYTLALASALLLIVLLYTEISKSPSLKESIAL
jgi:hypothetical protein